MFGPFVGANSRDQKSRTRLVAWPRISIALAFIALSLQSENAQALELEESAAPLQWCLSQRDGCPDHPACYQNMFACLLAAIAHTDSCAHRQNQTPPSDKTLKRVSASMGHHRRRARSSPQQHQFSAAERNELYRQFQDWRGRSTDE
jgi:hypothetical protein